MIAVQVAITLTAITAVVAVAAEGGLLLAVRRHAQATADAAALAATTDLFMKSFENQGADSDSHTAQTSATDTAVANGFLASNVTVRLSGSRYLGGPGAGTPVPRGYAEVTVTYYLTRSFSNVFKILGDDTLPDPIPVSARAVARGRMKQDTHDASHPATLPAVLILDPQSGSITGNLGDLTVSGGSVVDSSSSSQPIPDPIRYLPEPVQPPKAVWSTVDNINYFVPPGAYGVDQGDPNNNLNGFPDGSNVYFQSSSSSSLNLFYLASGGLTLNPNANYYMVSSSNGGALIFNAGTAASNALNLGGIETTPTLNAPTGGIYQGIAYFQARSSTAAVSLGENGSVAVDGTVYAPNASVSLGGGGSETSVSQIISRYLNINGKSSVDYEGANAPLMRQVQLVE